MTAEDAVEDWDLEGLVAQMTALYGSDITVEELQEEVDLSRESLMQEFSEDALDAYNDRESGFGPELMREIERFVILQVVDTRWREHLESMDYLREGVHLRAMAQKDPLVEYRGEGHIMFEELSKIDPRGGRRDALPRRGAAGRGRAGARARRGAADALLRARDCCRRGRHRRRRRARRRSPRWSPSSTRS